uniref:hypothetical protein n=1 Tax=Neorhizobium sp. EC2-8 TaxID=3129230 RepID=UPI003100EE5B
MKAWPHECPQKSALAAKLDGLKTLAAAARETAAERRFNIEDISEAMTVAASAGLDSITVAPDAPLDLREAPTAKESAEMLTAAGFDVAWEKRQPRPDEPGMWVMIVEWRRTPPR